ncbi:DUF2842 domain-containing protein [Halodurantibacterium flavum]|uniref:DUF2842 domain-containing protein n=1 Tax=Halodurantibacterium flavum TaxID=1382802 RepID=A0ABW4S419_9RHOB
MERGPQNQGAGLSHRARRRWALFILLVGLPVYVVVAVNVVEMFERPSIWVELLVFVVLGIVWALPFRFIFRGVGRADPDADPDEDAPKGPRA